MKKEDFDKNTHACKYKMLYRYKRISISIQKWQKRALYIFEMAFYKLLQKKKILSIKYLFWQIYKIQLQVYKYFRKSLRTIYLIIQKY